MLGMTQKMRKTFRKIMLIILLWRSLATLGMTPHEEV